MERDDDMLDDQAHRDRRVHLCRYVGMAAGAVAFLVVGAAGGVLWSERYGGPRARPAGERPDARAPAASSRGKAMSGKPRRAAPAGQLGAAQGEESREGSVAP